MQASEHGTVVYARASRPARKKRGPRHRAHGHSECGCRSTNERNHHSKASGESEASDREHRRFYSFKVGPAYVRRRMIRWTYEWMEGGSRAQRNKEFVLKEKENLFFAHAFICCSVPRVWKRGIFRPGLRPIAIED